jgi:hypothetical protein
MSISFARAEKIIYLSLKILIIVLSKKLFHEKKKTVDNMYIVYLRSNSKPRLCLSYSMALVLSVGRAGYQNP